LNKAEIRKRIAELKEKKARIEKERIKRESQLKDYERANKVLYLGKPGKGYLGDHGVWKLNPAQEALVNAVNTGKYRIIVLTGANQIGKTTFEVILSFAVLRGHWPWEDVKIVGRHIWAAYGWKGPTSIRWIGGGWEEHIQKNLIEQGLEMLWPQSWPVETRNNNMGVKFLWTDLTTRGQINFMSHNQKRKAFAGWKGHLTLFDEPFPPEIWPEVLRGLVAKGGIVFIGATLVEEDQSWIEDQIIDAGVKVKDVDIGLFHYKADMYVNEGYGLTEDNIKQFESLLSEDEKKIRVAGESLGKRLKVLKIDQSKHFIYRKTIKNVPKDWLIDISIDYHPNKSQYIHFLATAPYNIKYLVHEIVSEHGKSAGADWIGKSTIDAIFNYGLARINRIIIDPLSKGGQNAIEFEEETVFSKVSNYFAKFGFDLEVASKHKEDGIIECNALLEPQVGEPRLYIFSDGCPQGANQLRKWRRDEMGKPSKENDDAGENLYRLVNLNTEYTDPRDDKVDEYEEPKKRNPVTGY
jgi:hypothetical protein